MSSASNQTYMRCSGSQGSRIPHFSFGRESETSSRPCLMNATASLRRKSGTTKSGRSSYSASSRSWKAESLKNQFSSRTLSSRISWIGQVLPGPSSRSVLKSAQRGQYQPS